MTETDWFYSAVEYVYKNGLFAGTGADTFSPVLPMTRAMFWTVLFRLDGQSVTDGNEFEAARIWAMEIGITDGSNPEDNITREQMIAILWRYAGSPQTDGDLGKFLDWENVAGYAVDAIAWAVKKGIIVGNKNYLMPKDEASRAQVAAVLQRYMEKEKVKNNE